jgi:hypothetical protein
MTTRKLLEYVYTQAEKFGWETQIEGTGICDHSDGYEQHLWLSKDDYEMEFYYYIKPKNNGYDYSITNTPLTRSELGDGCEIIRHEYTTKEQIDEYFRASGPSLEELRNHFLKMFK